MCCFDLITVEGRCSSFVKQYLLGPDLCITQSRQVGWNLQDKGIEEQMLVSYHSLARILLLSYARVREFAKVFVAKCHSLVGCWLHSWACVQSDNWPSTEEHEYHLVILANRRKYDSRFNCL